MNTTVSVRDLQKHRTNKTHKHTHTYVYVKRFIINKELANAIMEADKFQDLPGQLGSLEAQDNLFYTSSPSPEA